MPYKKKDTVEEQPVKCNRDYLKEKVNAIRLQIDYRLQEAYKDMALEYGYSEKEIEKIHKKLIYRYL
jgi:hypothetical protein